ncbi:MAG: type I asparaginase [Bacteroidetes bacterium]|nr:type I asparaginase [Bacteroidota bacterium]
MNSKPAILLLYTGGTIGMILDKKTGVLKPYDFSQLFDYVPTLKLFDYKIDSYSFDPVVDSSNMNPFYWGQIADVIEKNYESYDGFVVLHGSDTMAYTASALSFMLQNLNKPVILTGSQLPLGMVRSDGRENFITSVEIAAAKEEETPIVPEVCIYFENRLYRGNRTHKANAEHFGAFRSPNYPVLAEVGTTIKYNRNTIHKPNFRKLKVFRDMDCNISILKLFPGITEKAVRTTVEIEGLKALVLESYGTGNAPDEDWLINILSNAISRGLIVLNISQCEAGSVLMGKYETSLRLIDAGVISGGDMTTESAVTKLMYLLGNYKDAVEITSLLKRSLVGEVSME